MFKKGTLIIFFLIFSSLPSFAGDEATHAKYPIKGGFPVWVMNPNYDGYLGAVGIAKKESDSRGQRMTALRIAQSELAKTLVLMIDSKLSINESVKEKGLSFEYLSTLRSASKQDTKRLINDSIVKDKWLDKKTGDLYLWVVIEKRKAVKEGLIRGVEGEGSCAVINMSAEQSQLVAKQRARAAAIEKAAGVEVAASTLITNFELTMDMIKSYSRGFIVREELKWFPLGQYRSSEKTAPIPEYRVRIKADVYIPQKKIKALGLRAALNNRVFRAGEKAVIDIESEREAKVAIFNFSADDKVTMLFPNDYEKVNIITGKEPFRFPSENSSLLLETSNLPGNERDAEALFVVAMDKSLERTFLKLFTPLTAMTFSGFFKKYSEIADYCEDVMLPYEIVSRDLAQ